MTTPADKPLDRSEAVRAAKSLLDSDGYGSSRVAILKLARAVLEMDERLRAYEQEKR